MYIKMHIKKICALFLFSSVLLIPHPLLAQSFRYIDESGNIRFVDRLDDVPLQYRNQVLVPTPAPYCPKGRCKQPKKPPPRKTPKPKKTKPPRRAMVPNQPILQQQQLHNVPGQQQTPQQVEELQKQLQQQQLLIQQQQLQLQQQQQQLNQQPANAAQGNAAQPQMQQVAPQQAVVPNSGN